MKIILLDIDGVLNVMSESYNTAIYRPDGTVVWMDAMLVQRLNWLIDKCKAHVVISSSWRLNMEDLKLQLEKNGFTHWDKVVGKTPYNNTLRWRGDEIKHWLDNTEHDVETYVVLEDEIIDVCGDYCDTISEEFVVEVDMKNGLSHQDVEKAKNILNALDYKL